ncbi:MAG: tyrosine-type recombinase/integrase, partial [Candidatus Krumholzibacteriota bacterium]|nr:tyrosine-type recombinase/integrase [Candidatus Krumholzibacteriota bacterium]
MTTWDVERYKSKSVETVSKSSANRELAIIKRMLNLAVDWGLLDSNPASRVKLFKEEETPIHVLTDDEEDRLLASAPEHLLPILIIALHTGMRRGEIAGQRWADVDFTNKLIHIGRTRVDVRGHALDQTDPKTRSAARTLPIPDGLLAELKAAKARQAAE